MRKLLTFLKTLTAALAVIVLFTACKQLLDDPEDFLSYWASEAFVKDRSIVSAHRPDGAGVPCVGSSDNVLITLTAHNPKNFPFVMPSSSEPAGIVEFKELSHQPAAGADYELKQTGSGTLELTYKQDFLKRYEQGSAALNPTITLKAKDGRVFKQTYTFGIKSNTPPPKPKEIVLAKTKITGTETISYYVLCLQFDSAEMTKKVTMGSGTVPIHKDIAKITINDSPYTLLYKEDNSDFQKPAETFSIGSFIESGNVEILDSSSPDVPSGWVLYFKTGIQVQSTNPQTSYTVTLRDKEGVTSDEALKTIAASDPTYTVTFSIAAGKGELKGEYNDGSYSSTTQNVGNEEKFENVPHGTQVTFTATPAAGWEVAGWTKNDAAVNGTNNTCTISVTENTTVTVKFYQPEIDGTAPMSWKALLSAVRNAPANATIKINGEINATPDYGNYGEILINKNLTIKGSNKSTDILNAITLSRIFKVKTGNTLTLENITLKNGKAPDDTKDGGGIYSEGTLTLKNTTIEGCQAANGGALYVHGATVKITNCTLMGNKADTDGGAVYAEKKDDDTPAHITIEGGAITNNTAVAQWGSGGGIYINDGCTLTLDKYNNTGTEISGNKAGHGGGVQAINSTVTMTKCTITGNHATNKQGGQGGGVSTDGGELTMTGCSITENTVPKAAEGGVWLSRTQPSL